MKINDKGLAAYASSRECIDKEGFLDKKGDLNHSYKKRWFVLKGNLLFYFEKPADKQPIGMIVLENCSVEVSDCDRFSFCVRYQSLLTASRTYTLCAENDTEMERWMKCITSASFGYIDMLVKEFEKTLQRLKSIEDSVDNKVAMNEEQSHSEVLLSKAKHLLDLSPGDVTDSSSSIKSPKAPKRKKHLESSTSISVIKDVVQSAKMDMYTINTLNRLKTKSLGSIQRSKSSENVTKERGLISARQSVKNVLVRDRSSAPAKENNSIIDTEEYNKTTFEMLHTCFGAAIWTKIGETL